MLRLGAGSEWTVAAGRGARQRLASCGGILGGDPGAVSARTAEDALLADVDLQAVGDLPAAADRDRRLEEDVRAHGEVSGQAHARAQVALRVRRAERELHV